MNNSKGSIDRESLESTGTNSEEELLPSSFLRNFRPEFFSDSSDSNVYELDRATFEHSLETLTNRNLTHEFEIFCRKLCERTICPNLRPATGPEGGGDSKVDTETFTVASGITQFWYVGSPEAGSERWAFAFSANKRWSNKVRNDVASIVGTHRNYARIFFVTSRYARSRDRARIEDELKTKYGIPVEIHDRSWIVEETIEKNRIDLAFNYLNVGSENINARMGPKDHSHSQQLQDIEKLIGNPSVYEGMETHLVAETLLAAKLSRMLERPRTETDGRFDRASRLATKYGTHQQQLEVLYETIQTAYWWFDDLALLNSSYDQFCQMLRPDEHIRNVEFLLTLTSHLGNCVIYGHFTAEECRLTDRSDKLRSRLESIAGDQTSPNRALEARTLLVHLKLLLARVNEESDHLPKIWAELIEILEHAKYLAEYDARGLLKLIEILGPTAGNNSTYSKLIRKTADFVNEREGDVASAQILKGRAMLLEADQNFEKIRLLGEAARKLTKKECEDELVDVLHLLAQSYRDSGLLWAARATCLAVGLIVQIKLEREGNLDPIIIEMIEVWALVALELRHIPDMLCLMDHLEICLRALPLSDELSNQIVERFCQIDLGLGCQFLNCADRDVKRLTGLPDVLSRSSLVISRNALLYRLGYAKQLQEEANACETVSYVFTDEFFFKLASASMGQNICGPLICNSKDGQVFQTSVCGLEINVKANGSTTSILVAECVLGSIEAFLSTLPEHKISPHVETLDIRILEQDSIEKPVFSLDTAEMRATLTWPTNMNPFQLNDQFNCTESFLDLATNTLNAAFYGPNVSSTVKRLFVNERVDDRVSLIVGMSNSFQRITEKPHSRLSDYVDLKDSIYTLRSTSTKPNHKRENDQYCDTFNSVSDHRRLGVHSVTNTILWDRANWIGTCYVVSPYDSRIPPTIALVFENREAAINIFSQWRKRFGTVDQEEYIQISIVKEVSFESPAHYDVIVTAKFLHENDFGYYNKTAYPSRLRKMTPNSSENLDQFICKYRESGEYFLTAMTAKNNKIEPILDFSIRKRNLSIKRYAEIKPHDVEAILLT